MIGLFWEVPIMLSIVYIGKFLNKKGFWDTEKPSEAKIK